MAIYDSTIRRSVSPPDDRWPYYWEIVADPKDGTVLAGWAATPLDAADNVRHAMTVVSPQGPPHAYKVPVATTHALPKWPDGRYPTIQPYVPISAPGVYDDQLVVAIAARRNDSAFMDRLAKSIQAHRHILDRLDGRVEFGKHTEVEP